MTTIAIDDIYRGEFGMSIGGATDTLRVSGAPSSQVTTGAGDTPANTAYSPRLAPNAVLLTRTMFTDRRTSGKSAPSAGEIRLRNEDFALDYLKRAAFDGREGVLYRGQFANTYPSAWTKVLDATMLAAQWDLNGIRLAVRDAQKYMSVPLQTNLYLGNNVAPAGLEGDENLTGKPKPLTFGAVDSVPLVCVNRDKQIYQYHDGAATITTAYDEGDPLTNRIFLLAGGNGSAGFIYRSTDGRTWLPVVHGFGANNVRDFAFGAGLFVAVGGFTSTASVLQTSPDGITWTTQSTSFGANEIRHVVWNGSMFVAGDGAGHIETSTNGTSWTPQTAAFSGQSIQSITWGGTLATPMWVAQSGSIILSSPNGTAWTSRTTSFGGTTIFSTTFSAERGLFVAVGDSGKIAYSSNGTSWTQVSSLPTTFTLRAVAYGGGVYVAVGDNGVDATTTVSSIDGQIWRSLDSAWGPFAFAQKLFYGGGRFYVTGPSGIVNASRDGSAWGAVNTSGLFASNIIYGGFYTDLDALPDYANTTDLQDDSLAPAPGKYKVCPSAGMVRLGSAPIGKPTADVVQGATSADRTCAALIVLGFGRAGLSSGDWSASDITTFAAAVTGEIGFHRGIDDAKALCADLINESATTGGAAWFADGAGVQRVKQLTDPLSANVVASPSTLTTGAGWSTSGTLATTGAYSTLGDISFTRITNANGGGQIARAVTLTGNSTKRLRWTLRWDGVTGTTLHGLYDDTDAVYVSLVAVTWAAGGVASASASAGAVVSLVLMDAATRTYGLIVTSASVTASHTFHVYPIASATATSIQISRVTVENDVPAVSIDDNNRPSVGNRGALGTPLTPIQSADDNSGIPPSQMTLRYGQLPEVLSNTDIAGTVDNTERLRLSTEWRSVTSNLTATLTEHPLSLPTSIDTLFIDSADAQAECTRRHAVLGVDREWYEIGLEMTTESAAYELGDVVEIISNRFGFPAGRRARIMGIKPEAQAGNVSTILFTLWL